MDNNNQTAQAEQTSQPENTPSLSPKEAEVEEKKRSFYLKMRMAGFAVIGFVSLVVLAIFARYIYNQTKDTYVVDPDSQETLPEQEMIINQEEQEDVDEWEIYSSDMYGFSFDYPKGDGLVVKDVSEDEFLVQVNYADIVPGQGPSGENLVKGYIFRVIPLRLTATDAQSAALAKRDWFLSQCPQTATVTNEYGREVAGLEAITVDVYDCNSDYSTTYLTANDFVYEISQIFKGDLGFKQIYRSRVNQILDSLVIDVASPELSPFIEYRDRIGFSFLYPRGMNSKCCSVPAPPVEDVQALVVLAENDNSDALGFYYSYRVAQTEFDQFIDEQKAKLTDEYMVVKNTPPEGSQTELSIAGQSAVMLSGYSWRGNDIIYIPFPSKNNVLMISKMDVSEDTLNSITQSLELN